VARVAGSESVCVTPGISSVWCSRPPRSCVSLPMPFVLAVCGRELDCLYFSPPPCFCDFGTQRRSVWRLRCRTILLCVGRPSGERGGDPEPSLTFIMFGLAPRPLSASSCLASRNPTKLVTSLRRHRHVSAPSFPRSLP
jgi:hypothetical protein